jgi:hypothetical protein
MSSKPRRDSRKAMEAETSCLREAANLFFPGHHVIAELGLSPGSSGSIFARVDASGKSWCLRRWPPGFEVARLRFIHLALQRSRAGGFSGVPDLARTREGESILLLEDGLYDAQEWSIGEPISPAVSERPMPNVVVALPSAGMASLATAVACFHRSAMRFSPEFASFANPLSARLALLREDARICQDALPKRVRLGAEGRERRLALRWLDALPQLIEAASVAFETFAEEQADGYTLNHGDLWPNHAYFDGNVFAGFTDFESLCFASPAFDLAQAILHFGGWNIREAVLRSYERIAPLSDGDRSALPVEAGMDLASEGCWSLDALYGDASSRTTPGQRMAHLRNLHELAGSLEVLVTELKSPGR